MLYNMQINKQNWQVVKMASFKEVLKQAQARMEEADLGEQAALLYLLELTNKEAHNLYMEFEEEMPSSLQQEYEKGLTQLLEGKPLSYILGYTWFYGYQMKVNEDVLIPRPETEELVSHILVAYDEHFSEAEEVVAVDIGTGSGAIAITLKKEEPHLQMYASDISSSAIEVAKENAQKNEAEVTFMVGNMLDPMIEKGIKVDFLISNPPYIPQEEEIEDSVLHFEPHLALFGGEDGLKFYREIFQKAPSILKEKAVLAFEIGYLQKEILMQEAKAAFPHAKVEVLKDINEKDRMLFIYI